MNRRIFKKKLPSGATHHIVLIDGESCVPRTTEYVHCQRRILQMLLDNPDLTACHDLPFKKMILEHDGTRWNLQLEAVEAKNDEEQK